MCEMNATCPIHGRNDVKDAVENDVAARAVTYLGEYVVATLDNPEYQSPLGMLATLLGEPAPGMFMHLVVKVDETGCLGDVLDSGTLKDKTIFRETFLPADDSRLDKFIDELEAGVSDKFNAELTTIMHESHDLVVDSVRNKVIG